MCVKKQLRVVSLLCLEGKKLIGGTDSVLGVLGTIPARFSLVLFALMPYE